MLQRSTAGPLALLCAAVILMPVAGCEDGDSVLFPSLSDELSVQLVALRTVTEPFQQIQNARDAGYEALVTHPTNGDRCLTHGQLGGMGFHYLNPDLVDDSVSVTSPEVVIYEPQPDGSLELVAVEYVVPFAIRADDQTPPILLGQEFRRNYTFDVWALHAWAWRDNSSGVFSDWNPDVSCEAADAID